MFDEKLALMAALKPRPKIHINVKKKKSFKVVRTPALESTTARTSSIWR
jgi:hypothetical protein